MTSSSKVKPFRGGAAADYGNSGQIRGVARILTCNVATIIALGHLLITALPVLLTLFSMDDWGDDLKRTVVDLEVENLKKLAADKAEYLTWVFGRVKQEVLQLQGFAEQSLLTSPEKLVVDNYLQAVSGLEEPSTEEWNHSVWFINDITTQDEFPTAGSSLEGLLNRSSLADVPFRSLRRQESVMYLAALEDPFAPAGSVSSVNFQLYPAMNMSKGFTTWDTDETCDERCKEYGDNEPTTYDPRCRVWYQDAVQNGTTFTNPYVDVDSGVLTVTAAAPVHDASGELLGVVGTDIDFRAIRESILSFRVVGDEGYAYVLAPNSDGVVTVHRDLDLEGDGQNISSVEEVNDEEFGRLVGMMYATCSGSTEYMKNETDSWILSWEHENSTSSSDDCEGGFIVVVTVQEDVLSEEFNETVNENQVVLFLASVIMVALVEVIFGVTACCACAMSEGITRPVNQLIDVVRTLNRLDFSHQGVGTWMLNDVSSPEVDGLMQAFQGMTTVVKFANMTLSSGNIDDALKNYEAALIMFKKLGNERGVSIVNNNLGNVYTLQALELDAVAGRDSSSRKAKLLLQQADAKYRMAVTFYKIAIADGEMLCTLSNQNGGSPEEEVKSIVVPEEAAYAAHEARDVEAYYEHEHEDVDGENSSPAALRLQLMNRKFNLAQCLANKGGKHPAGGDKSRDPAAIVEARRLLCECLQMAADRRDAIGDERQVEYLIAIAVLERDGVPSRRTEAMQALDDADRVVAEYRDDSTSGNNFGITFAHDDKQSARPSPAGVLRQRLLVARGELCLASGEIDAAISYFDQAVVGCGHRMNVAAVRTALLGLKTQALAGRGRQFSPALLRGLGVPMNDHVMVSWATPAIAIDRAVSRLHRMATIATGGEGLGSSPVSATTKVDLCFIMDCTGSMQRWIDQSKTKLLDIIAQTKEDVADLELRVAYVGYRDFGDKKQYEGPYDFHTEDELPELLNKLKGIQAYGGGDLPEDMAGGFKHAVRLSWESPIRLCVLIADAPCHGAIYHTVRDRYPAGCPNRPDPAELLYTMQHRLGIDFYFIRITPTTDKMIRVFKEKLAQLKENPPSKSEIKFGTSAMKRAPLDCPKDDERKFVVHNLESNDNGFLDAVVQSVKWSAGINLMVEGY